MRDIGSGESTSKGDHGGFDAEDVKGPGVSLKMTRVAGLPTGTSEPVAWEGECLILVVCEADNPPVRTEAA